MAFRRYCRHRFAALVLWVGVGLIAGPGPLAHAAVDTGGQAPRNAAERAFRTAGKLLIRMPTVMPRDTAGLAILFTPQTLATHELYLVNPDKPTETLRVGKSSGLRREGELLVTPGNMALFLDGRLMSVALAGWETYWVTSERALPRIRQVKPPPLDFTDGFMRDKLADETCRIAGGKAALLQRGGGMATTDEERGDATFGRAVNPFSVHLSRHGTLSYDPPGEGLRGDFLAEACFYFGVPVTSKVVDVNALPLDTDMLVAAGGGQGAQVAFGWVGRRREFVLMMRAGTGDGAADWTTLKRWDAARPPLTNWMRLGLSVERGSRVGGWLDGAKLLEAKLDWRVAGPVRVMAGAGLAECDDVRIRSLPLPAATGTPYYVQSRQFAGKAIREERRDPKQFRQWAESASAFLHHRWVNPDRKGSMSATTTALPLIGDFEYEALSAAEQAGKLPDGTYSFRFLKSDLDAAVHVRSLDSLVELDAIRKGGRWAFRAGGRPRSLERLRLARLAAQDNRVCVWDGDGWLPLSEPAPQPLHLAVCRVFPRPLPLLTPSDFHQRISCGSLVNEFFEEAPTDWIWVDGTFRMAARWACENLWNFMAGGSTEQPMLTSKRRFSGDQIHEAYMSLRPMLPWDAGDTSFDFDPVEDKRNKHAIHNANKGWYSRRDLNFSFCMDGVDPLSGYSVIFGGDDNRHTLLLRRGRIVATTTDSDFLFPTAKNFLVVHWFWVRYLVRREGNRLRISINDKVAFDYTDPEPLEGGHLAFWSVRNGFVLSRVSSMAEETSYDAHSLYVPNQLDAGPWTALKRDRVAVARSPRSIRRWRATNLRGGGFFAVRHTPAEPVDLARYPVLELPLELGDAKVNLHLQVDGRSCLLPLSQPDCDSLKALLTPPNETGECFRLSDLDDHKLAQLRLAAARPRNGVLRVNLLEQLARRGHPSRTPRLESLTLGNAANPGYILAGGGGNAAGSWYEAGTPSFVRER